MKSNRQLSKAHHQATLPSIYSIYSLCSSPSGRFTSFAHKPTPVPTDEIVSSTLAISFCTPAPALAIRYRMMMKSIRHPYAASAVPSMEQVSLKCQHIVLTPQQYTLPCAAIMSKHITAATVTILVANTSCTSYTSLHESSQLVAGTQKRMLRIPFPHHTSCTRKAHHRTFTIWRSSYNETPSACSPICNAKPLQ